MLVGIHQLHYLPWLRYFEKIARVDAFIVLDNIQFNKNGWQNRNRIKSSQGAQTLTVPVLRENHQRLDEVRINNGVDWRAKHWRTLCQCYGKAPFFNPHAAFFEATYQANWDSLNALNQHMLTYFVEALGINTRIVYASALDAPGVATERLVQLIQAVGGNAYYSGAYALDVYLDAELLKAAGIGLVLQAWTVPVYPQRYGAFVGDLSIVDLLFNCGPRSLEVIQGAAR